MACGTKRPTEKNTSSAHLKALPCCEHRSGKENLDVDCPYHPMAARLARHFLVWQCFVSERDRDPNDLAPPARAAACGDYAAGGVHRSCVDAGVCSSDSS